MEEHERSADVGIVEMRNVNKVHNGVGVSV